MRRETQKAPLLTMMSLSGVTPLIIVTRESMCSKNGSAGHLGLYSQGTALPL